MPVQLRVFPDTHQLVDSVVTGIIKAIFSELETHNRADIVLTGGGVGTAVALRLIAAIPQTAVDWSRVNLWWGDERFVPISSVDRNDVPVVSALAELPPPRPTLYRVGEPSPELSLSDSAFGYAIDVEKMFAQKSDSPGFTVVLLGLGPDGHVASIFPGHPSVDSALTCLPVDDSPKPPAHRVSMSLATLSNARHVWILASGAEKHDALDKLMTEDIETTDIPARGVRGQESTIVWVDRQAAFGAN
ncbi:MAG: 6-phosphogluconolactonase [Candidatus Nanopelagicales bacterium]|nr:6-phosphogluconolactonase [Candidatus Nanopelagicales bacterium]